MTFRQKLIYSGLFGLAVFCAQGAQCESEWDSMYYDNPWKNYDDCPETAQTPDIEIWLGENTGRFDRTQFTVRGGMPTYPTPKGAFWIYWKDREHKSSQWYDAPMPCAMFFSGGVAIHQGPLSSSSHGCVRVSMDMAKYLFSRCNEYRTRVIVYP